jgi:hypothetical protein
MVNLLIFLYCAYLYTLACLGSLYSALFLNDDKCIRGWHVTSFVRFLNKYEREMHLNGKKKRGAWLMEKFDHLSYYFESSYTFLSSRVTSTK